MGNMEIALPWRTRLVKPFLASIVLLVAILPAGADEAKTALFRDNIKPILQRCVGCHGGDEPAGMLDLTTREGALKGGETGPALKPGSTKESLLFGMTSSRKMPPKKPLTEEQIADLKRWIE